MHWFRAGQYTLKYNDNHGFNKAYISLGLLSHSVYIWRETDNSYEYIDSYFSLDRAKKLVEKECNK